MFTSYADDACEIDIAMPPREELSLTEAMKKGRDEKGNWGVDKLFTVHSSCDYKSRECGSFRRI